jgi:hypothetical protein
LNDSGWLIGQGVTGTTFDVLFGISAPVQGKLAARPTLGGPKPALTGVNATVTVHNYSHVRLYLLHRKPPSGGGNYACTKCVERVSCTAIGTCLTLSPATGGALVTLPNVA